MKSKIFALLMLIPGLSYGQSVPNTTTFSLQNVYNVVDAHTPATTFDLTSCFANAISTYFDANYASYPANSMLRFRNYTIPSLAIGTTHQGGVIAYFFVSGDAGYVAGQYHGIIVAGADIGNAEWGCSPVLISGADGVAIGTGRQNTLDILASCSTAGIAARLCDDYSNGGYSDWFLPSRAELQKVYLSGVTGFASDYFWTSTQFSTYQAYSITWVDGTISAISKPVLDRVRAIRYF